jgi:hypothetical protein
MQKAGKRYPLVLYTRMIDRWWPAVFALGLGLFGLAWALYRWQFEPWRWRAMSDVGGFIILISLLMFAIRKSAYIRLFANHMRLVTPFLRLNISYRRLRHTSLTSMSALFPPKSISSWRREILEPLYRMTAIVIELNGYPISQTVLRFFLSPFFFKDRSPHFVILIKDWMRFSTELESLLAKEEHLPGQGLDETMLYRFPRK